MKSTDYKIILIECNAGMTNAILSALTVSAKLLDLEDFLDGATVCTPSDILKQGHSYINIAVDSDECEDKVSLLRIVLNPFAVNIFVCNSKDEVLSHIDL